jgi:hypothetical protein
MVEDARYRIYGHIPEQHEMGNPGLAPEDQQSDGTVLIYATDSMDEAKKITTIQGGFEKGDPPQWYVATWALDTETGGTMGDVPEGFKYER